MLNSVLILLGKVIVILSRLFNLGHGSTWPGHIALSINPHIIKDILKTNDDRLKIILVAGTNGKTTTGKLIQTILENSRYKVFQNEAGANLLNGIASSLLMHSNINSIINYDYAIFEIDEATLPLILKEISPDYLILLNLFRDQLDRYGEVNTIASKWRKAFEKFSPRTIFIFNADDPQIAYLGYNKNSISLGSDTKQPRVLNRSLSSGLYFGINNTKLAIDIHQHATDSTYCPNCNSKLNYDSTYYSHLGDWECKNCSLKRPNLDLSNTEYYPVPGTYNRYNTLAAVLLAKQIGIQQKNINSALHEFTPAFGRQEILYVSGKKVQIFLSKNPTSFNESLRVVSDLKAKNVLLVLNDRIPDGRDVSWIWDVDFEDYVDKFETLIISGDRAFDMGLRIKYSNQNAKFKIIQDLKVAVKQGLELKVQNEILYVLPTYSAMLEVREILIGRKIL